MADAVGMEGLHSVSGTCDLCGMACDPNQQELNALDCTFPNCASESNVYHQDCLEKYLKSIKLEKNRKTGFKCPRGTGKGTRFGDSCPGRIDKSHPIISRSDTSKKRRKAKAPEPPQAPLPKAAPKPKPKVEVVIKKEPDPKPKVAIIKKDPVPVSREQLAAAARAARKEIGLPVAISPKKPIMTAPSPPKETKTLEEFLSQKERAKELRGAAQGPPPVPAVNAWARPAPAAPPQQQQAAPPPPPPPQQQQQQQPPQMMTRSASQPSPDSASCAAQPKSSWAAAATPLTRSPSAAGGPGLPRAPLQPPQQQQQQLQQLGQTPARRPMAPQQQPGGTPQASLAQQGGPQPWGGPSYGDVMKQQLRAAAGGSDPQQQQQQQQTAAAAADDQKLTKSQKKNMKRAEKKAAQRKAADGSDASSETSVLTSQNLNDSTMSFSEADSGPAGGEGVQGQCAALLRQHLLRGLVQQLEHMGFVEWAARAAIARYGNNLEAAASWLLEVPQGLRIQDAPSEDAAASALDVSAELGKIQDLQSALCCSSAAILAALHRCGGNLEATVGLLYERSRVNEELQQKHMEHVSAPQMGPRDSQGYGRQQQQQQQQQGYTPRSSMDGQGGSEPDDGGSLSGYGHHQQQPADGHAGPLGGALGLFGGMFGSQLKGYIGGGQAFTELVNFPQEDGDPALHRSWSSPVKGSSWASGASQAEGGQKGLRSMQPMVRPSGNGGSGHDPHGDLYSSVYMSPSSPQLRSLQQQQQPPPQQQFGMMMPDGGNGELQVGLALGSELLGLVSAEEEEETWGGLPAFFADNPLQFEGALEDSGPMGGDTANNPVLLGLSGMDNGSDRMGMGSSFWTLGPGQGGSGWGSAHAAAAPSHHYIPEAALLAAAGVVSDDLGPSPGLRDGLPDDRELDALMATLVCR